MLYLRLRDADQRTLVQLEEFTLCDSAEIVKARVFRGRFYHVGADRSQISINLRMTSFEM